MVGSVRNTTCVRYPQALKQFAVSVSVVSPQSSSTAPEIRGTHSSRRTLRLIDKSLYWIPILTATFLAKLAIPPLGANGISVAIPLIMAVLAIGLLYGRMVIEPKAMTIYLILIGTMVAMQSTAASGFSLMSLALLAVLHLPYGFRMLRPPRYSRVIDFVQTVGLVLAVLGIIQYGLQFVVGPALAFPLENYFPNNFIVSTFNQQAPLQYGSRIYRANGMVMVEPSIFSQFLAICIIIELLNNKRWWFVALALVSMLLSYSGTGIVLLVASLTALAISRGKFVPLMLAGAGAFAVVAIANSIGNIPYISVFMSRATELTSSGSSGFARFVGGYYLFDQFLWPDLMRTLVGFGAGTFRYYASLATYPVSEMAIFKVIFEFGVVGAVLYFGFLAYCFARSSAPFTLRVALAICLILSGNYFPFAHSLAFVLLVWTGNAHKASVSAGNTDA